MGARVNPQAPVGGLAPTGWPALFAPRWTARLTGGTVPRGG
jgi:hypothetical protein